jgi:hypothetical protein
MDGILAVACASVFLSVVQPVYLGRTRSFAVPLDWQHVSILASYRIGSRTFLQKKGLAHGKSAADLLGVDGIGGTDFLGSLVFSSRT